LLNKLCDLHAYINDEVLTSVINLLLFSRGNFEFMKLIVISIKLENKEFQYIDADESTLCID